MWDISCHRVEQFTLYTFLQYLLSKTTTKKQYNKKTIIHHLCIVSGLHFPKPHRALLDSGLPVGDFSSTFHRGGKLDEEHLPVYNCQSVPATEA